MSVKLFVFKDLAIQSYVIEDETTHECVVIDPPRIIEDIKAYIDFNHLKLKAILETHVHADFISGARELKHAYQNEPIIFCSVAGGTDWLPNYADRGVKDRDTIKVGSLNFIAMFTPGHTPEHISWLYSIHGKSVGFFTGDFLFKDGVGRPDLLGEQMKETLVQEMRKSLFERIADVPDNVEIFPAHGAGSLCSKSIGISSSCTLGQLRKSNPAFTWKSWKQNLLQDMPAAPARFSHIKELNLIGVPLLFQLTTTEPINKYEVIDFRSPQEYGKGHMAGAIHVPLGPSVGNWLASVLTDSGPLLCILPDEKEKHRIINLIRLLGYDEPIHTVTWHEISNPVTLEAISPQSLHSLLQNDPSIIVVDVRTPTEWQSGHIDQAQHIELSQLQSQMSKIPKTQKIVTTCGSGWRSSVAASLFQKQGYQVSHLAGGMGAWQSAGFSTIKNSEEKVCKQ